MRKQKFRVLQKDQSRKLVLLTLVVFSTILTILTMGIEKVFANRTVSVVPSKDILRISNPSSVNLNYNLTCYQSNGVQYINNTFAINLNESKSHPLSLGGGACVETSAQVYNNGMNRCNIAASVTYPAAASACGAGHHVCTIVEYNANRGAYPTVDNAWVDYGGMSMFSFSTDGTTWTDYSIPTERPVTSGVSGERISTGAGGAGSIYFNLWHTAITSSTLVMCCPGGGGVTAAPEVTCKITVTGDDGHLICPDFKGGTPF